MSDVETFKAFIEKFQRKHQRLIERVEAPPGPRPAERQNVYIVKEEQKLNVGADDVGNGFWNELGDLKDIQLHGIYRSLDAANEAAREYYEEVLESLGNDADTVEDKLKRKMLSILVEDRNEKMIYSTRNLL